MNRSWNTWTLAALVAVGVAAATLTTGFAAAQDISTNIQDAGSPVERQAEAEARGVDQVVLAAQVAAWGRRNADADALRLAARILGQVPLRVSPNSEPNETPVVDVAALNEEADLMSSRQAQDIVVTGSRIQRDRDRAAEAAAPPPITAPPPVTAPPPPAAPPPPPRPVPVPPPPPPPPPVLAAPPAPAPMLRGVAVSPFGRGPVSTLKRLGSRERWGFVVDARASEVLRVAAVGDGDTNIDLIVTDARGRVLCDDRLDDHYPVCSVPSVSAGRIRIDIVNRGPLSTKVQVLTN